MSATIIQKLKLLTSWCHERVATSPSCGQLVEIAQDLKDLTNFRPAKGKYWGTAINKAGRLVLRGHLDGTAIKIYEAANPEHALFIRSVSENGDFKMVLPKVLALRGSFVIAEWVQGDILQKHRHSLTFLDELTSLQCLLHRSQISQLPRPGFDYWHDFILPRFERAAALLDECDLAMKVRNCVEEALIKTQPVLMHPDLTPGNVVRTAQNELKIVDNELLTWGGLAMLDVCNTAYSLGSKVSQKYVDLYLGKSDIHLTKQEINTIRAAWLARLLGSTFVKGDMKMAHHILGSYKKGLNILPAYLEERVPGSIGNHWV